MKYKLKRTEYNLTGTVKFSWYPALLVSLELKGRPKRGMGYVFEGTKYHE